MQDSLDIGAKGDHKGSAAVRDSMMKKQYDFASGGRGKFYRSDAELHLPIYLEPESAAFLREIAEENGTDVQQVVNDLIRRDIDDLKSAG